MSLLKAMASIMMIGFVFSKSVPLPARADDAASKPAIDVATLDVAGVRLGMTPDEAAGALKRFDPTFKIQSMYDYGMLSVNDYESLRDIQKKAKFVAIGFMRAKNTSKSEKDDIQIVEVGFSRVPGAERVISVHFYKEYNRDTPSFDSLKASLSAKYPSSAAVYDSYGAGFSLGFFFDKQGKLINNKISVGSAFANGAEIPNQVYPSGGVTFKAEIPKNHGAATFLKKCLYDEAALYGVSLQTQEINRLNTKDKSDDLARTSVKVKF